MQNEPILKLINISHQFFDEGKEPTKTLANVSFELTQGTFTSIVGPSGCGKSTLLRIILGLVKPTHGALVKNFKQSAIVFQNFAIFPWLTVEENVEFGLKMQGLKEIERKKIAKEKIGEVGLAGFEKKYPKELSGGMRQRVSIARALTMNPELLLMDEPFSSIDAITAGALKKDISNLWQKYKITILMVTHLISEAIELSDQIIVLSKRPGTVKSTTGIDLARPRNTRSPEFFALVDSITSQIDQ